MRSVPSDIASKLSLKKQTRANKADPSASIWIGRPTTALTTDVFLERQEVLAAPITDVAIAVSHPRVGSADTDIYAAYITNGKAKVMTSILRTKIENHFWVNTGFEVDAEALAIAFDGQMPKSDHGTIEFVTDAKPWIFWVHNQVLYGRKLDGDTPIVLAETNCLDVAAVRAMWSEVGGFDFGLICFFILGGGIYYRQLIDGVWTDAEAVTFGPTGVSWTEVVAFRTWDYRVGLQAKTTDGEVYELFTQFMGIGKHMTERIDMRRVDAVGTRMHVGYKNTKTTESILLDVQASGARQWPLPVYAVAASNINDGADNWGVKVVLILDNPCNPGTVESGNENCFNLKDSVNAIFYSSSVTCSADGLELTITFADFNGARGDCTIAYTPGSIKSPLVNPSIDMLYWTFSFEPINLVPLDIDPPEVVEVYNI